MQASFIPKKPLTEARGGGRGFSGLVFLVAVLVFVASVAAAGGAFMYQRLLQQSLDSKKNSLAKYQEAFDLPSIQALVRFDSRIREAKTILASHVSPSAIFAFLSEQTLERVQFLSMKYELGDDGVGSISLEGVTNSFSTIALQSDQLGASKALKDIVFSDITVEEGGKVSFTVSAKVDPALLLYSKNLTTQALPLQPATPPEQPAASTTPETETEAATSSASQ